MTTAGIFLIISELANYWHLYKYGQAKFNLIVTFLLLINGWPISIIVIPSSAVSYNLFSIILCVIVCSFGKRLVITKLKPHKIPLYIAS